MLVEGIDMTVQIGTNMSSVTQNELVQLFKEYADIFAYSVIFHELNILPGIKPVR